MAADAITPNVPSTPETPGGESTLLIEAAQQEAERWVAATGTDGSMSGAAAAAIRSIIGRVGSAHVVELTRLRAEIQELREELNTERLRLAACGVAAHGGTTDGCDPAYRSDSLEAVLALRAENQELRAQLAARTEDAERWAARYNELWTAIDEYLTVEVAIPPRPESERLGAWAALQNLRYPEYADALRAQKREADNG